MAYGGRDERDKRDERDSLGKAYGLRLMAYGQEKVVCNFFFGGIYCHKWNYAVK